MPTENNAPAPFRLGIETFLKEKPLRDIKGCRVGLVSHLAAVDQTGATTAQRLYNNTNVRLSCLMGPEHGYFGGAAAGETCRSQKHPDWNIPIYSLYGKTRKPRSQWLRNLDLIVVDLQDLGCRAYTYCATLKLVLQSAAEAALPVIVLDRPIPLPCSVDGPILDDAFESFVSALKTPVVNGMTPGETAIWLQRTCIHDLDLTVIPMQGYHRETKSHPDRPPFMRPSPSIVSRESAICFPATVFLEGLPHIDHGRQTDMPFQLVAASWTRSEPLAEALNASRLPGVAFHPHRYLPPGKRQQLAGVRITITNPARYRPVLTGITMLSVMAMLYGNDRIWNRRHIRTRFFDQLMGTDTVRLALLDNTPPTSISTNWKKTTRIFHMQRRKSLLYPNKPE